MCCLGVSEKESESRFSGTGNTTSWTRINKYAEWERGMREAEVLVLRDGDWVSDAAAVKIAGRLERSATTS